MHFLLWKMDTKQNTPHNHITLWPFPNPITSHTTTDEIIQANHIQINPTPLGGGAQIKKQKYMRLLKFNFR